MRTMLSAIIALGAVLAALPVDASGQVSLDSIERIVEIEYLTSGGIQESIVSSEALGVYDEEVVDAGGLYGAWSRQLTELSLSSSRLRVQGLLENGNLESHHEGGGLLHLNSRVHFYFTTTTACDYRIELERSDRDEYCDFFAVEGSSFILYLSAYPDQSVFEGTIEEPGTYWVNFGKYAGASGSVIDGYSGSIQFDMIVQEAAVASEEASWSRVKTLFRK